MLRKRIIGILLILFNLNLLADSIKVLVPNGLPALSVSKMISNNKIIADKEVEYKIEKSSDSLVVDMLKREGDIAIVPSNFSSQLYNKGLDYHILGTVGWGSFYLISRENIKSLDDLKNREVYTFGKGLTPDIIFQLILNSKELDSKDVKINYLTNGNELATLYLSKKINTVVIPEPMLSKVLSKDLTTHIVSNLNDEWKNIINSDLGYPQSTLVVKKELYQNEEKFIKEFIKNLNKSISSVYKNREETIQNIKDNGIVLDTTILDEILKRANIYYTPVLDCQEEYNKYFEKLNEMNSKVIGGKIPDEEIFAK